MGAVADVLFATPFSIPAYRSKEPSQATLKLFEKLYIAVTTLETNQERVASKVALLEEQSDQTSKTAAELSSLFDQEEAQIAEIAQGIKRSKAVIASHQESTADHRSLLSDLQMAIAQTQSLANTQQESIKHARSHLDTLLTLIQKLPTQIVLFFQNSWQHLMQNSLMICWEQKLKTAKNSCLQYASWLNNALKNQTHFAYHALQHSWHQLCQGLPLVLKIVSAFLIFEAIVTAAILFHIYLR